MKPKQKPRKGFQTYSAYVEEFERAMKIDRYPVINFVSEVEPINFLNNNSIPSTLEKDVKKSKMLQKMDQNPNFKLVREQKHESLFETNCPQIIWKDTSKKSNKSQKLVKNAFLKDVIEERFEISPLTVSQKKTSKDCKRSQNLDKNLKLVSNVSTKGFLKAKDSKESNKPQKVISNLNITFVSEEKSEKFIETYSPLNVSHVKNSQERKELLKIDKNPVITSKNNEKLIATKLVKGKSGKLNMEKYNDDNIRIISKFSLYEDLDREEPIENTSEYDSYCNYKDNPVPYTAGCDWTTKNWLKSGMQPSGKMPKPMKVKLSKGQKEMMEALNTPVKMTKAESMMRKMGWKGGALGKNGYGLVAPIVPNMAYTWSNVGFGQVTADTKKSAKKPKPSSKVMIKRERKQLFNLNVLQVLLEFLKNDSELEIGFDERLSKTERRAVHMLVQSLFEDEVSVKNYDSNAYLDLISDVKKNCVYMLGTHSVGEDPNRQLYIYKEAPEHVYLVVPNDLIPEEDKDDKPKVIPKPKIEKKESKCNEFNIFKKPIGQPSLGELISKVYKEHEENEARSSHEINAELKKEGTAREISEISGEMSSELNSEIKESETVISSNEITSELNSDNKECETVINSDEISVVLNSENKICNKPMNSNEINTETKLNNKDSIEENIDEVEKKKEVSKQLDADAVNAAAKECSEENCVGTNADDKIMEKQIVGEVKAGINLENALEEPSAGEIAAEVIVEEEKSETNIGNEEKYENDVKSDVPFPMRKLTDYFLEFFEDEYKEMRFLGPFDAEQNDFINSFVENVQWCIRNSDNAKTLFEYRTDDVYGAVTSDSCCFYINEDDSGVVILKLEKTK